MTRLATFKDTRLLVSGDSKIFCGQRHISWLIILFRFIQGKRRTWHCGAHTLVNSQETCLVTGLAAAKQIGAEYPVEDSEVRRLFNYYVGIL